MLLKAKEFVKTYMGPEYNRKVVPDLIRSLIPQHQYFAFYRKEDIENNIHSICFNRGWNEASALAIYGEIEITSSSGIKFGSCLIVPNTTPEQLAIVLTRGLKMKAFL